MRFVFTMNMPPHKGEALVHQVIGEYPVSSLGDLIRVLSEVDFLLMQELYIKRHEGSREVYLEPQGDIALNPLFIGKIKEWETS